MAVAVTAIDAQREGFKLRLARQAQVHKFFGKCLMADGSTAVLVAKAADEAGASKKLHNGYKIVMVMDILTVAQMPKEWAKIKPSLLGGVHLK